ncbi:hypothetical protein [Anaeromyxobacter sp. K]|uniref:hypothetical protein n=1 Tax=Anaeromyxobacter sp. (strain K) TaxID=447217 RepID=UPI0012FC1397|nr:hypothetical protein [Anaeromyxobacter sp. K]
MASVLERDVAHMRSEAPPVLDRRHRRPARRTGPFLTYRESPAFTPACAQPAGPSNVDN